MQLRAEKTKLAILAAAEKEFSDLGFFGARVDEIAKNSGANKALIYKYFGNKLELYKIVFKKVYDRFTEQEQEILISQGLDYKAKIRRFVEMEFDFCKKNPNYVKMIMWENLLNGENSSENHMSSSKKGIVISLGKIIEEVESKNNKSINLDPKQLLLTLYSCCFYYFTNMKTMSYALGLELSSDEQTQKRIDEVYRVLIAYLESGAKE